MNDYIDVWGVFMRKIHKREEYYELTLKEVITMINEHYVQNYLGEVSNTEEWVEKWLNKNIKDEA